MGAVGSSADNAAAESLNASFKRGERMVLRREPDLVTRRGGRLPSLMVHILARPAFFVVTR